MYGRRVADLAPLLVSRAMVEEDIRRGNPATRHDTTRIPSPKEVREGVFTVTGTTESEQ
jgi:hypothetical protein